MGDVRALFLYSDNFDLTTATRRILSSSKTVFPSLKFLYWARNGYINDSKDEMYDGIDREAYLKTAKPRSLKVLWLTITFQLWLLRRIISYKPTFINAFYFYTIAPALIYKYFFNWKCKVVYDPRDYVAVCFRINPVLTWCIKLIDNIFIKLANKVVFPDNQYFTHYGMFKLNADKYYILPNSTEDFYAQLSNKNIHNEYNIPQDSLIIPLIGYFSETRGKQLFYDIIAKKRDRVHFIVAGEFREQSDIDFFSSHSNVSFLGKIPYLDALWIMKNSSFVPLLYDPVSLNNKYAYPTKYYDSLMVGTPVLVSYGQVDVWEATKKYDAGNAIEYNNLMQFEDLLDNYLKEEYIVDKNRIRNIFLEHYDFNIFKLQLRNFYSKIILNNLK